MRDLTFSELERLQTRAIQSDETLQMDQQTFTGLYARTARPLWVFLLRRTGDAQLADDLLQETYYRFLRTPNVYESDAHRRNYLYRIAANLAVDSRRGREPCTPVPQENEPGHPREAANPFEENADLSRALGKLRPRQREALWLAYAEGSSHEEIAQILGLKTASVKLLLFRARRKLASLMSEKRIAG